MLDAGFWRSSEYDVMGALKRAVYANERWQLVRADALDRDRHQCLRCGKGPPKIKLTVHHIVAMLDGGTPFDLDNLRTLCQKCHGDVEQEERRKRMRLHPETERLLLNLEIHRGHAAQRRTERDDQEWRADLRRERIAITTVEKAEEIQALRRQGLTWQAISNVMGCHLTTCYCTAGRIFGSPEPLQLSLA